MSSTGSNQSLVSTLWRRRTVMYWSCSIAAVLAVVIYFVVPPRFESKAKLLVVRKGNKPVSTSSVSQPAEFASNLAVHQSLLTSDAIIERAMEIGNLNKLASINGQPKPVELIFKSLFVEREMSEQGPTDLNSSILEVSYRSSVATDSPRILKALIASYQEFLNQLNERDREERRAVYQTWIKDIKSELTGLHEKYAALKVEAAKLGVTVRNAMMSPSTRLTEVEKERILQSVKRETLAKQLDELKKAQQNGSDPSVLAELASRWMPAPTSRTFLQEQLQRLQTREAELLQRYGAKHPLVIDQRKKIEAVQQRMGKSAKKGAPNPIDPKALEESIRRELTVVTGVVRSMDDLVDDARKELSRAVKYFEQAAPIRAEIDQQRALLTEVTRQMKELDLVRNAKAYAAEQIVPPQLGIQVVPSAALLIVILGALGVLSGCAVAILMENSDPTTKNGARVHEQGQVVLGQIPTFDAKIRVGEREPAGEVCVFHRPNETAAKSLEMLRTTIFFSAPQCRVIQVTSPTQGNGKTLLAANLATAIAKAGKSVLLIDLDLANGRQHRIFGLSNERGIMSYLNGADALEIHRTTITDLSVLPCGPTTSNSSELLLSDRFKEIIAEWRTHYEYVVIDSSAVLLGSDAATIAAAADGVVVAGHASQPLPEIRRAVETIESIRDNVLGVVVNGVTSKDPSCCGPIGVIKRPQRHSQNAPASQESRQGLSNNHVNHHDEESDAEAATAVNGADEHSPRKRRRSRSRSRSRQRKRPR